MDGGPCIMKKICPAQVAIFCTQPKISSKKSLFQKDPWAVPMWPHDPTMKKQMKI